MLMADVDDVLVTQTYGDVCTCQVGVIGFGLNFCKLISDGRGSLRQTCEFGLQQH